MQVQGRAALALEARQKVAEKFVRVSDMLTAICPREAPQYYPDAAESRS